MTTEPIPASTAADLHGAPYSGSHELQRCETCSVSVLRPDPDDIDAIRRGEEPEHWQNQGKDCRCVGGHQLHRCGTCTRLKVIRADASIADERAHGIPLGAYAWAIATVSFALLFLRLHGVEAWVWSVLLWSAVLAAGVSVYRIERRRRAHAARRGGRNWER